MTNLCTILTISHYALKAHTGRRRRKTPETELKQKKTKDLENQAKDKRENWPQRWLEA